MQILIIGQDRDPHISSVAEVLRSKGHIPIILDCYSLPEITFRFSDQIELWLDGTPATPQSIGLVWWRQKPSMDPSVFQSFEDPQYKKHWIAQWRSALESIEGILDSVPTVNGGNARRIAQQKIVQLKIAREVGFETPFTLVSNNAEDLTNCPHSELFFKSLSPEPYYSGRVNQTAVLKKSDIVEYGESILPIPYIYQNKIVKSHELRVCAFGQHVRTFKVDSQKQHSTLEDWRSGSRLDIFTEIKMADESEARCHAMLDRLGLHYGVFDFAVTPEGQEVFFEVNMDGQWYWLERVAATPLAHDFANMLERVASEKRAVL